MKYKSCTDYWLDTETLAFRGEFEAMYRNIADPWGCEAGHTSLNNRVFLEVVSEFRPYERIIDFGCGLGGMTALISERFPDSEVIGCDISGTAVEKARALHPAVTFCRANLLEPVDALGTGDLVIVSEVFWYVLKDLGNVFRRLQSLLRPHGILGIHQYFPTEQRYGRDVIDGLSGFDAFVAAQTTFVPKARLISQGEQGVMLLAAYTPRSS